MSCRKTVTIAQSLGDRAVEAQVILYFYSLHQNIQFGFPIRVRVGVQWGSMTGQLLNFYL